MKRNLRKVASMILLCAVLAGCAGKQSAEPAEPAAPVNTPASTNMPVQTKPSAPAATPEPTEIPAPTADPIRIGYEDTLFDTAVVHRVDVSVSEADWADLLQDPIKKQKYHADVTIDGETVSDVSFATKGNSSLYFVADEPGATRFSFKLNFGKYVDGQTFRGLDKLNLNNQFCDAAGMKDTLCYMLFRRLGVPAPLTSYVWLTINGADHGLYLAVEDFSDGYLDRVRGGEGVIYKPESRGLGLTMDAVREAKKHGLKVGADPHGADLIYRDDAPESYPDIFKNAETHAEPEDDLAVIAALKLLAEGADPKTFLDTEEIIRFFAVHNFLLNYDSYTGAMLHNLVLYENAGILSVAPWDYNLAFGTFTPGVGRDAITDMTDLLNQGIDTPLIGTTADERPMWRWIVESEEYLASYHAVLAELTEICLAADFDRELRALEDMLLPYVEKDPTAFYSAEEFRAACDTLRQVCLRRAESVRRQLDGTLASVSELQRTEDKVDASDLRLVDMGAFVAGEEDLALAYPDRTVR